MIQSKHFFLFTIGPVQSFIVEARKTQDLYGGSLLLSHLMAHVAYLLQHEVKAEMIFPSTEYTESMPNRLLVVVEPTDIEAFRQSKAPNTTQQAAFRWLGEYLEQEVKTELIRAGEQCIAFMAPAKGAFQKAFAEQLAHHLEVYWAACSAEDYMSGYHQVNHLLGMTKHSRSFGQWEEAGRKCSLDGIRNALIFRPFAKGRTVAFLTDECLILDQESHQYLLNQGEGLSALSFTKRRFKGNNALPFDSTSDIALLHTLGVLSEDRNLKRDINYLKGLNAQLFYEENTRGTLFNKILGDVSGAKDNQPDQTVIQEKQQVIAAAAKKAGLPLSKYYAVVLFDGDGMGKWWSGDPSLIRPGLDETEFRDLHQTLATCLAQFSHRTKAILESDQGQRGRFVYSGGDDFLGFINLEHLLAVLQELRSEFQVQVAQPLTPFCRPGKTMSFSAGVVIAHYKEPLRLVMQELRKTEKKAKNWRKAKDVAAFYVMRGSGEHSIARCPFYRKSGQASLSDLELLMVDLAKNFAGGTTSKIGQAIQQFPQDQLNFDLESDRQYLIPLIIYQLQRSQLLSTQDPQHVAVFERVYERFVQLIHYAGTVDNFVALLDTLDFMIRQTSLQYYQKDQPHAAVSL